MKNNNVIKGPQLKKSYLTKRSFVMATKSKHFVWSRSELRQSSGHRR